MSYIMGKYTKEWWDKAKLFQGWLFGDKEIDEWLLNCKDELDELVLILLYYTGARPCELCMLKWGSIMIEDDFIKIGIPTLKKGVSRSIYIPINKHTEKLIEMSNMFDKDDFILRGLKPWNVRDRIYRITQNEMCPYFFRHNRLSKLANEGVDVYTLKKFKGAKTISSVEPYIILAGSDLKKIADKVK